MGSAPPGPPSSRGAGRGATALRRVSQVDRGRVVRFERLPNVLERPGNGQLSSIAVVVARTSPPTRFIGEGILAGPVTRFADPKLPEAVGRMSILTAYSPLLSRILRRRRQGTTPNTRSGPAAQKRLQERVWRDQKRDPPKQQARIYRHGPLSDR